MPRTGHTFLVESLALKQGRKWLAALGSRDWLVGIGTAYNTAHFSYERIFPTPLFSPTIVCLNHSPPYVVRHTMDEGILEPTMDTVISQ